MPLNTFFTSHTFNVNGILFQAGRWTEAWETPELVAKVHAGLMAAAKPIEQVPVSVAPPVAANQLRPTMPLVIPNAPSIQLEQSVHPSFAAPAEPATEQATEAAVEPEMEPSIPVEPASEPEESAKPIRKRPGIKP